MALADLTRDAVLQAIAEYDALGGDAFLRKYGYRPARSYFLVDDRGRRYPSAQWYGSSREEDKRRTWRSWASDMQPTSGPNIKQKRVPEAELLSELTPIPEKSDLFSPHPCGLEHLKHTAHFRRGERHCELALNFSDHLSEGQYRHGVPADCVAKRLMFFPH